MSIALGILSAVWALRIALSILSYVYLWWLKEYRFDRMWLHLQTPYGRRILLPALHIPRLSPKTVSVTVGTVVILLVLFATLQFHMLLRLFILDIMSFPVTGLLVSMVSIPTYLYHQFLIRRAVLLLRKHKHLIVIGITGSYGKTSTKEFLATILAAKYRVLKTEASKNSAIGIAETVLKGLTADTQMFIVEMGAYKRGEIQAMVEMVQPEIGIVTAINPQHQDLFGSLDTTMQAKYELIRGLRGRNIAIINADNQYTREMGVWAKRDGKDVWWFTKVSSKLKAQSSKENTKTFSASDIKATLEDLEFTCTDGVRKRKVNVPLLGQHQISNVLTAIAAAVAVGMDVGDAMKAARRIKPFPKTMEPIKGIHGATFINDTFNNNPDAAKAAIAYLAKTKGRKILVFQPMIELGKYTAESHKEVGREAGRVCDDILLTNKNYYAHFVAGAREVGGENKVRLLSDKQAAMYIDKIVRSVDTVLFKGKESERVLKQLQ